MERTALCEYKTTNNHSGKSVWETGNHFCNRCFKDDSFTNESGYVLLTFLLLNRKREHPLRLLTDVIWESTDMGNPYNSIKNVVYRLRKTLACIGLRDLIQASHGTFTLNPNYTILLMLSASTMHANGSIILPTRRFYRRCMRAL